MNSSNTAVSNGPQLMRDFVEAIKKDILGYDSQIEMMVLTVVSGGHVFVLGRPGTAKTLVAEAVARLLSVPYERVQCTPDLMPSDIFGTEILRQDPASGANEFIFCPGPLLKGVVVVADEITRAQPRTQSAFLQAMAEKRVTFTGVSARTIDLSPAFVLMATGNPWDRSSTFELPFAQLDRFAVQLEFNGISREDHRQVLANTFKSLRKLSSQEGLLTVGSLLDLRRQVEEIHVSDRALGYVNDLVYAVNPDNSTCPEVLKGVLLPIGESTRAGQWTLRLAQARAFMHGQTFVTDDDIRAVLAPVLRHRLRLKELVLLKGQWNADRVVAELLMSVPCK